jgi:hypothetical protein
MTVKFNNSPTPWKTDLWYTSPWNFSEEARKGFDFSKKIQFHDVSLRDGEQQSGLIFTKDQKVALAEKLAEVGIHRIEAGMPAVSDQDEGAIKEIVRRNLGPEIFAFARCMKDDVKRALDCGVKSIVMEVPTSDHLLKYAYRWEVQKAIDVSIESTLYARDNGMYVSFFTIDGTRTGIDEYLDLIELIAENGYWYSLANLRGSAFFPAIPVAVDSSVISNVRAVTVTIRLSGTWESGSVAKVYRRKKGETNNGTLIVDKSMSAGGSWRASYASFTMVPGYEYKFDCYMTDMCIESYDDGYGMAMYATKVVMGAKFK